MFQSKSLNSMFFIKMMGDFKCLSYNVKGLQNKVKRISIFNFCKDKIRNNGIVLLQESHSSRKDVKRWKSEWGADIYLNHGSSNSSGTLIAFSKNFEKKRSTIVICIVSKDNDFSHWIEEGFSPQN